MAPLAAYLPFNRECITGGFEPAKKGAGDGVPEGRWLLLQEQSLVVRADSHELALPTGRRPDGFEAATTEPICLGSCGEIAHWVLALPKDAPLPPGYHAETIVPMRGTKLPDDLLTLGGMAAQALWWESTSGFCPRCGQPTTRIAGEWGKKCAGCGYEHYPHLHPATITMVRDTKRQRVLLARKAEWAPGRYALVAGFVDNGESLEGCVRREVKEEVGVDVGEVRYVGSQNWPFPSQIMCGFIAEYEGGDVVVDTTELEDARWFPMNELPIRPSRHSIAGYIIQNFARP
ncbi:MAG: NAD(+) diphosphatase [Candidatus Rokubacteria bacterium]|nr:NAD(+) diphosphatase [Candidatus Rokubacteria bacterium]